MEITADCNCFLAFLLTTAFDIKHAATMGGEFL